METLKPTFYFTLSAKGGFPLWWPPGQNIMVTAAGFWWPSRGKFVRRSLPASQKRVMMDSGGFVAINLYGDYPWSVAEYIDLIRHYQPDFAFVMDYPCEPEINRPATLTDNRERIIRTLDNTGQILACETGRTEILPIIQGYTLNEYRWCIDEMARRGLLRSYMGVGSMCRRMKLRELRYMMLGIYEAVCEFLTTSPRLHWLGLKLAALAEPVCRQLIHSCDSAAWSMCPGGFQGRRYAKKDEAEQLFYQYRSKVRAIVNRNYQLLLL